MVAIDTDSRELCTYGMFHLTKWEAHDQCKARRSSQTTDSWESPVGILASYCFRQMPSNISSSNQEGYILPGLLPLLPFKLHPVFIVKYGASSALVHLPVRIPLPFTEKKISQLKLLRESKTYDLTHASYNSWMLVAMRKGSLQWADLKLFSNPFITQDILIVLRCHCL